MLSGLSRIFRKPFANVHISRKVPFARVWQIYACGPRCCKTFHGFLHGDHIQISTGNMGWETFVKKQRALSGNYKVWAMNPRFESNLGIIVINLA